MERVRCKPNEKEKQALALILNFNLGCDLKTYA